MNDQNRLRLERIAARHASRPAPKPTAPEPPPEEEDALAPAFLAAFARARDAVLRPAMAEVGLELKEAGHGFRIDPGGDENSPSIDLRVILPDRGDSRDTVRFLAKKDAERGWQVVGELELKGSPVELTRFETAEEITHDVVEQLVVDAVEQMLASTAEAPRAKSPPRAPAPAPAAAPAPPVAPPSPAVELAKPEPMGGVPSASPTFLQASPARTSVPVTRESLAGTSTGIVSPQGPALPFAPGRGALPARSAPDLGGTLDPSARAPEPVAALPFAVGVPAAVAFENAKKHADAVQPPPAAPPAGELGATAFLDEADVMHQEAVPFAAPAPQAAPLADLPQLTVEQYASLRVELRMYPDRTQQTLSRYGVPLPSRALLDKQWRARFDEDAALHERYGRAYAYYQESLARPAGTAAPREPAPRPAAVQLSLEQYASLWAELSAYPNHTAEVYARYRIHDGDAWAAVRQHWEQQMLHDPALRARWTELVRAAAARLRAG
jgi:hypothetical protein